MSNQHTVNHNDDLTLVGALRHNRRYEAIVEHRDGALRNAAITPIPWMQIHRANVPHLARHSS